MAEGLKKETRSRSWKCRATSGESTTLRQRRRGKCKVCIAAMEMNEKEKEESGDDVEETS